MWASIGALLAIAQASGSLRTSVMQALLGSLIISVGLSRAVSYLRTAAWHDLMSAVQESERRGALAPNFPENSRLPEVNRFSAALNGAARSILASQSDLDRAYLQFVETMAEALDARDPYTAGHSLRVAAYSHALALAMGLSDEEAETIRIAARLHDIGKIGIPDAVLQKPGALTPEECGLIKLHPQIGRRILERVGRFDRLLPVVELHHENHDGTGYPYGLSGSKVPLAARIVHVADSFDAMTTTRSYRAALPIRSAVHEIERNAGRMFDPVAAKTFLRLLGEGYIEAGILRVTNGTPRIETRQRLAV
ncbi:MAG TPA: HD-GYP domain-containing protein [Bryobacteraceae bacterium]|nr:HD-GYP domain-containing protein [Bryobacteraceae bacterium]